MSDTRKPWEIPISYNEDRFVEPSPQASTDKGAVHEDDNDDLDERDSRDVEELLRRPDRREDKEYECVDTTPVNYKLGPHDKEFGVEESDFDEPDADPVPYDRGPHEEVFEVDEDEELEEIDEEDEFPED